MSDHETLELELGGRVQAWAMAEEIAQDLGHEPLAITKVKMLTEENDE